MARFNIEHHILCKLHIAKRLQLVVINAQKPAIVKVQKIICVALIRIGDGAKGNPIIKRAGHFSLQYQVAGKHAKKLQPVINFPVDANERNKEMAEVFAVVIQPKFIFKPGRFFVSYQNCAAPLHSVAKQNYSVALRVETWNNGERCCPFCSKRLYKGKR
jgi:hypothetical protein